ncbi:MAG TPA: SBBP repeat-containing protein [Chthonomonadaceae bacterium]|nr:SBBP repeat-containing protein [Chthonomonadaceae bacterium]
MNIAGCSYPCFTRGLLAAFCLFAWASNPALADPPLRRSEQQPTPLSLLRRLPLCFEPNVGQTAPSVRFLAHGQRYTLFLTDNAAILALSPPSGGGASSFSMQFVGAHPAPPIAPEQRLAGRVNYLRGRKPQGWHTEVPTYEKVRYQGVYPGVDLLFYGRAGQPEYDFVIHPGASPADLRLRFTGMRRRYLDPSGALCLDLPGGAVRWHPPVAYQEHRGRRTAVACRYVLLGNQEVRFQVGGYDPSRPLIVDPLLIYASYLGGNGATCGYGIATDGNGNLYVTGETTATDFPTVSPLQTANQGGKECFVACLSTQRSGADSLVYATYLGGSGDETGYAIALSGKDDIFVTGKTNSPDFPTTSNAVQPTIGGAPEQDTGLYPDNAFLVHLSAHGATLAYATYLGGSESSTGYALAVDKSGIACITGETAASDFPVSPGAFQTTFGSGAHKAFITRIDTRLSGQQSLVYSTFLGGEDNESGRGIALDARGNAYITGETTSTQFPTTPNAYQQSYDGGSTLGISNGDAFVVVLNPTGASLLYSTLLGGSGRDEGRGIALGPAGNVYVTGITGSGVFDCLPNPASQPFPTTRGAFQTGAALPQAYHYGFVARLDLTRVGSASLVYSSYISQYALQATEDATTEANAIAVDAQGDAYITGETHLPSAPSLPYTLDAFQSQGGGGASDAFLFKLDPTGSTLLYASYLGGSDFSRGNGIAVDGDGNAYLTGETGALDFPASSGASGTYLAYQSQAEGLNNAFVARVRTVDPNPGAHALMAFQHDTFQMVGFWAMNGNRVATVAMAAGKYALSPPNSPLVGLGDFHGDGQTDLIFQNTRTGQFLIRFLSGTQVISSEPVALIPQTGLVFVGVGDFNRDGKTDLVFQNPATGQLTFWLMNGATVRQIVLATTASGKRAALPRNWSVVGTGNFHSSNQSDLVLQNTLSGAIAFCEMKGTAILDTTPLQHAAPLSPAWKCCGVADFNGDGAPDLLMRNAQTGQLAIWYLKGSSLITSAPITQAPVGNYQLRGVR